MRGPRYRFPDAVRNTTRTMAAQMVREGEVAGSPEELDAWIAARPEVKQQLEEGGYGTRFSADDLFPLVAVFVERAGGRPATPEASAVAPSRGWIPLVAVVLLIVLLLVLGARLGWFS